MNYHRGTVLGRGDERGAISSPIEVKLAGGIAEADMVAHSVLGLPLEVIEDVPTLLMPPVPQL
jgi:hypothetical protein